MSANRRVIMFAPYFLPRRRVGSMRSFRFAIHLRDFGWDPVVLTIATPRAELTSKERALLEHVEIINIHPPFDRTHRSESQLGGAVPKQTPTEADTHDSSQNSADNLPEPGTKRGPRSGSILSTLDRQFPTDTWLPLFAWKYRSLRAVAARVRPHLMWATGDPWSALLTMRSLAHRFNTPWVADFRDPWTLSEIRTARQWTVPRRIDRMLERKIVASTDAIVFQAASVANLYRQHYADLKPRTHVIYNSFDPWVFDDPVRFDGAGRRGVSTDGILRIGFFGRFREMSPARLITEAVAAAARQDTARSTRIRVYSFGGLNDEDTSYAREKGVLKNFKNADAVPLQASLRALRRFDLLLVSTDLRRNHIIPAKIFEYLAAGRPILSLSLNSEVHDILARTGTGIQLDPRRPGDVAAFLLDCHRAVESGSTLPIDYEPRASEISRYEARNTTRELAELFDSLAKHEPSKLRTDH